MLPAMQYIYFTLNGQGTSCPQYTNKPQSTRRNLFIVKEKTISQCFIFVPSLVMVQAFSRFPEGLENTEKKTP